MPLQFGYIPQMDDALARLEEFAATADGTARQRLMSSLHKLAYSMETCDDTLHRYGAMHLQTAAVKVGLDLRIFKTLAERGAPLTVTELARNTGADTLLLSRILRYLSAIGAVEGIACDQYVSTHLTRNLADIVTEAGVQHYFETVGPQYQALPGFLRKTGYQNPIDEIHTAFQDAWNTSLHAFAWFTDHPENLAHFNNFMAFRRQPDLSWLTVYPVKKKIGSCGPESVIYVNIGGGIGHQCAQFKERYPEVPGRVILQDLPHSVAEALPTLGVENMAYDFFQPQPILGARFYFLRGVLHNHPPSRVLKILENIKEAMSPDSYLLIDEMILPEVDTQIDAASMDITMMGAFAGMERTEQQWRDILDETGLKLTNVYSYNPVVENSGQWFGEYWRKQDQSQSN